MAIKICPMIPSPRSSSYYVSGVVKLINCYNTAVSGSILLSCTEVTSACDTGKYALVIANFALYFVCLMIS